MWTAKWTSNSTCAAWYYKAAHSITYGQTSSCTTDSNWYYSTAWACSQTQCPAWYRDGTAVANKTAENVCLRNIPWGQYMATAKWTSNSTCAAWYYKAAHSITYGQTSSCTTCPAWYYCPAWSSTYTSCPSGYTSAAWAWANTSCYISVAGWKYKTSPTWSATANCGAWSYKAAHTSYYNSSDSCTTCPAWYYCPAAASTYTSCPSGYTSAAWAWANTSCYISVACGKYKTSPTWSATANCGAWTYKAAHTSYYNSSDSCSSCTNKPSNSYYTGYACSNSCGWGCNAWYYQNGSSCTACSVWQYSSAWSSSCSNCTNKPSNSYYTGSSTSNSCGWACNSWYVQDGNTCKVACTPKTCGSMWMSASKTDSECYKTEYPSDWCGKTLTCYLNWCTQIGWDSYYSCMTSSQIPSNYNTDIKAVAGTKAYCVKPLPTCWTSYSCKYWTVSSNGSQNWKCTASWKTVDCGLPSTCTTSYSRYPCPTGYTETFKVNNGAWDVYDCKVGSTIACSVNKCKNSNCLFYEGNCYAKSSTWAAGININSKCS